MLVALAVTVVSMSAAHAQPEPTEQPTTTQAAAQALAGTLRAGGEPVDGVAIRVTDEAGGQVGEAETDASGQWQVPVAEPGRYTITLDRETLPEGVTIQEGLRSEVQLTVGIGRTAQVAFPLASGEGDDGGGQAAGGGGRSFFEELSQSVANGLKFGLVIAMAAVGLSLVFGTTGLVNFSHGELVTFGAIAAWFLNTAGFHVGPLDLFGPLQLIPATVIAVALGAAVGGSLDRGIFRPLRKRGTGSFQRMVITIGLSLAARQLLLIWFGSGSPRYRDYAIQSTIDIGPVAITPRDLWIMGLSLATLLAVAAMLLFTRVGRAMRAVADNADLAESSGVDVQRIILFVWVLGGGLAALGGTFQGAMTNVNYLNGFQMLLLMFAAIILGGLGTAFGAVVGGIAIGLATEVSTVWFSSELKFGWALVVLVAVLLLRPQGIFGVRERIG
jgi:branched-chain amino acid transport system permease protein